MAAAKKPAAARRPDPDRVVDAAMALAADRRWRDVALADIAAEAKISLAELYRMFPSKYAILAALIDRIDAAVLAGQPEDVSEEPVRERLLDVLMRRFEALSPYKRAVASIVRDGAGRPAAVLCGTPRLLRSMAWSLESAGVSSAGRAGRLRARGLAAIYVPALFVWLRDDSPDMGRTMAHLDRSLRRAERLVTLFPRTGDSARSAPRGAAA